MQSIFHKDGPLDNPSDSLWTFVIFCQSNWNTIWGGEFCCNVGDEYVYVPYIPNNGCLFDCRNDHTGFAPNNLTAKPRLSLAYTFSRDLTLKSGNDTINKSTTNVMMEVFTVKEYQDRWDELMERVENGETFGIVNENGQAAVMMPADDETVRIYTENNNEGP